MKVKFKNLAKIEEAEIDKANLTLIVGDNSLGKTLLLEAYVLFINTMKDRTNEFVKINFMRNLTFRRDGESAELSSIFNEQNIDTPIKYDINYDRRSEEELASFYLESKSAYLDILKEKILMDDLAKTDIEVTHQEITFEQLQASVRFRVKDDLITANLMFLGRRIAFRIRIEKELLNFEDIYTEMIKRRVQNFLNRIFYENLYQIEPILFFPSERNMYKANAFTKSADFISDSFSLNGKDVDMRYSESLFVTNYLKHIDRLRDWGDELSSNKSDQKLYELLCKSMGGEPHYEDGVITSISQENKKLPSNLFSTKQNRLVPYFMLCEGMVNSEFIIIEEPEAHMSLKSMFELVEVVRNLMKNRKVILTSHSDVFVSLLNNMIKKDNIDAKVYELLEEDERTTLVEVEPGEFGYELSFMSEALKRLNRETREAFSEELDEPDE